MKSPRTTHEFEINSVGLKAASDITWECNPQEFVKMARMIFGLPLDGPPPMWHFLEIMRIVKDGEKDV